MDVLNKKISFRLKESIKTVQCLVVLLLLQACGGGGSDSNATTDSPPLPDNNTTADLTIEQRNVAFEAFETDDIRFEETIRVSVTQSVIDEVTSGTPLFIIISQTNPSFSTLNAQIYQDHGELIIRSFNVENLDVGLHQSTITVQGCYDQNCAEEFGRSTVNAQFNVLPELPIEAVSLNLGANDTDINYQISVDVGTSNFIVDNVRFETDYVKTGGDWLTLDVNKANSNIQLNLDANLINCGIYQARVLLDVTLNNGSTTSQQYPIHIARKSDEVIANYVAPITQYLDTPLQFTLHGCGFETIDNTTPDISGINVNTIDIRSDFEMEVFAQPAEISGPLPFSIGLSDNLSLQIKSVADYPSQSIATRWNGWIHYDQSNDTIYTSDGASWHAVKLIDNQWQIVEDFPAENYFSRSSLGFADDGSVVYAFEGDLINLNDAKTFELIEQIDLSELPGRFIGAVEPMLDGSLLVLNESAGRDRLYNYDLVSREAMLIGYIDGFQHAVNVTKDKSKLLIQSDLFSSLGNYVLRPSYETSEARFVSSEEAKELVPLGTSVGSPTQNGKRRLATIGSGPERLIKMFNEHYEPISEALLPTTLELSAKTWYLNSALLSADGQSVYTLYNENAFGQEDTDKIVGIYDVSDVENNGFAFERYFDVTDEINSQSYVGFRLTPDEHALLFRAVDKILLERIPD